MNLVLPKVRFSYGASCQVIQVQRPTITPTGYLNQIKLIFLILKIWYLALLWQEIIAETKYYDKILWKNLFEQFYDMTILLALK